MKIINNQTPITNQNMNVETKLNDLPNQLERLGMSRASWAIRNLCRCASRLYETPLMIRRSIS